MKIRIPIALLACAVLVSCGQKSRSFGQSTIEFVRSILRDAESPEYMILKSYDPSECDAAIYVIGDSLSCKMAAMHLVGRDRSDNIDGIADTDGLPDFAGERIAMLTDVANGHYDSLVLNGQQALLREITVRNLLKTVDTLCYLSPFDMEGLGKKSKAKVVVLASPAVASNGLFDVDSLLVASACELPVICPVAILANEIVESPAVTVGVITSPTRVDAGIYDTLFGDLASAGSKKMNCISIAVDSQESALSSFLDMYIAAGNVAPLDVLLVDDPACDVGKMNAELEKIRSVMNEEFQKYSEFLTPGFAIVEPLSVLGDECYKLLRERNLFTHRIALPATESYLVISRTGEMNLDDEIMIEYNSRYLPKQ